MEQEIFSAESIANRLQKCRQNGNGWLTCCPAHDDHNPSLSISEGSDGKVLFHCFVCKDQKKVIRALVDLGLWHNGHRSEEHALAKKIWDSSLSLNSPKAGPARAYLEKRGIQVDIAVLENLRFHPSLAYYENKIFKGQYPALVGRISNKNHTQIGLQRIYLDNHGNKAPVSEPKKVLGKTRGGTIKFSKADEVLHLAEGPETALGILGATKEPVWSTVTAGGMQDFEPHTNVKQVHIWVDQDKSGAGEKVSTALANRLVTMGVQVFRHMPQSTIPEGKKGIDWLDELNSKGAAFLVEELKSPEQWGPQEPKNFEGTEWPIFKDLPSIKSNIEDIPNEMIPESIRAWAMDVSERMQTPLVCITVVIFTVIASVIGRQARVFPKKHDDWSEVPNLWCGIVMRSGLMKTPIMRECLKPLKRLIAKADNSFEKENTQAKIKERIIASKIKAAEDDMKKNAKKMASIYSLEKAEEISHDIEKLMKEAEGNKVSQHRYMVNDTTVEKLGEIAAKNSNGLLLFRDELYGWLKNMEKQGREGDREFYLEAYNGKDSYTVDRISRGTLHIPALCISIIGGIQPGKLERYVREAVQHGVGDDGLLQRFSLMVYTDLTETWQHIDRPPDLDAYAKLCAIVDKLDDLSKVFLERGLTKDPEQEAFHFRFSDGAQKIFDNECLTQLEQRLRTKEIENDAYRSHLAKFKKMVPTLALIFHLIDLNKSEMTPYFIEEKSINLALEWADYLELHAKKIYSFALNPEIYSAHALANKINAGKVKDGMTLREIYRPEWTNLKNAAEVFRAIEVLESCGWAKVEEVRNQRGGAPSEVIRINPAVTRRET